MTDFDPLRANQEILTSMNEVRASITRMVHEWEVKAASAETNLNHFRKILGFVDMYVIGPQREKVQRLIEEKK